MTNLYCNSKLIEGTVTEAVGIFNRAKGLLGKKEIEKGYFMLFRKCNSIHTFFMKTDIDVIMTDKDGTVVRVWEDLKPWSTAACPEAADTLEMRAGAIREHGIKAGDKISFN